MKSGAPPVDAEDLGDVAVLPHLVNAHTHLEFSALEQPIGEPGISLASWIGLVMASRSAADQANKQQAIELGLQELWATGTAIAGEIMTPPAVYPRSQSVPELTTFAEILGLTSERGRERLSAAEAHLMDHQAGACSPHAPYSVSPELLEAAVRLAVRFQRSLAMHVAESPEERELLVNGSGPLAEVLKSLGVWRDGLFPWGADPFRQLVDRLAKSKAVLLVHGNQLNASETEHLAGFGHVTVVFCPRTHHFFRFGTHPVADMLRCGVRVALGTDSRASNPDLNLWKEVQFLLTHRTDLDPADVLRMATWNGAVALGFAGQGAIQPGSCGRLGVVRTAALTVDQLYRDFCDHDYQPIDLD